MLLIEILYAAVSLLLALYGFNSLYLLWRYRRTRGPRRTPPAPREWPRVTVQLPVYNELHTVKRLLRAVAALDYPRERLQVQVLDDSTDETSRLLQRQVQALRASGLDIQHLQRRERSGFKAGALAAAFPAARGEFIAIFDADFLPPPDFLRRALPWFAAPQVGCVQARWGHLNRGYSLLTRLQALAIDGHFIVEQTARSRSGYFLNFNGTGGIWRQACIQQAGGWQAGTLTEDLDLSYRAQLMGWRIEYLPDLVVPGELPAQLAAYKRQQARWARGSLQTARRLLPRVWQAALPWAVKLQATLHMTGYFVHPLILAALLLSLPLGLLHLSALSWAALLLPAALGPPLLFLSAAVSPGPGLRERLLLLPGLVLLGIGMSLNNSRAAMAGIFFARPGAFLRTPKFAVQRAGQRWEHSRYALKLDPAVWLEGLLGLLALLWAGYFFLTQKWGPLPWLLIYAFGYGYVFMLTLFQSARQARLRLDRQTA